MSHRYKLLLDSCLGKSARRDLIAAGHDVVWTGDWASDPGDAVILRTAHTEGRILITLDKDYGELAIAQSMPHSGIVRLVGLHARDQARVVLEALGHYGDNLRAGAIVTASARQLRIRLSG